VNSDNPPQRDRLLPLKLAVTRARIAASEGRDSLVASSGAALGHAGRRAVLWLHRREDIELPPPIEIGERRFDVAADLVDYTGLSPNEVRGLLERKSDSFRAEWFLASPEHRADEWFYRASSMYLFGNAVHDPSPVLDLLESNTVKPGRALEFGGGTGNLALALAGSGWSVDYLEHSALQKDFVAFRAERYQLSEHIRILHDWHRLAADAYDLVCAMDVFEHIEQMDTLLTGQLLPAIRQGGVLIESSPFVRTLSNPMHHEHRGLDPLLQSEGFVLRDETDEGRLWKRSHLTG
jgi:hypothetical protein